MTQTDWSTGPALSALKESCFDSCSLNAISFRVDLRAVPLKYIAFDPSFRVQATPWVNFNRWKFFLGYSNIPNPDQPWRGSVLASECGNGSPHWENKTHLLLMLAEDCHVHIQRKACGTVLGQRWAEIHRGKGQMFLIERASKACPAVSSAGGWGQAHAWRLASPRPSAPLPVSQLVVHTPSVTPIQGRCSEYGGGPKPCLEGKAGSPSSAVERTEWYWGPLV